MVGASLAVALAGLPLRVALVERVPFAAASQPSFDDRTVALSRTSQRILSGLGVWSALPVAPTPIRRIHVSERGRFGTALLSAAEERVPALGYVLENRVLGRALWDLLGAAGNVAVHAPASVTGAAATSAGVQVRLADDAGEHELTARLLVVADGARSRLRESLGIAARARSYEQVAIVGNVTVAEPGDGEQAWERFTPDGPLALLPTGGARYAFVLSRRARDAAAVLALPEREFLALLQAEFGFRLGRCLRLGRRSAYPLDLVQACRVTAPRVVVLGNAAHGLHPVAGQGYNLGLRDVAVLAELLADASRADEGQGDPGDPGLLATYRDWRRDDQRQVVRFTDGLIRLFDLKGRAPGLARGLGLLGFDLLPGAKPFLTRRTMGLGGRLTRLARGLPL